MDKGLREYLDTIIKTIRTLETFGGLKVSLRMFLKDLKAIESKQSRLTQKQSMEDINGKNIKK